MNTIKNIIFDYGAVIFEIDHQRTTDAFRELGVHHANDFFSEKEQIDLFDRFETGAISADDFRNSIRSIVGRDLSDQQIDAAWNKMLIGVPPENFELLRKIKEKYRSFLLSNNNEIHYNWIMNYLKLEFNLPDGMNSFFEKDYYSHLMGMRKPNKEIFEFVLKTHQLIPSETLFIDDGEKHIKTAKELGMNTILKTKEVSLEQILLPFL
jgi:glucose-1-phosphatase